MTFIIFIIILSVLVFIHELGHFLIAKKAGVYVEEFGFGYPPRLLSLGRKWGTLFSLNWIPFGGFVKIFGENYEEDSLSQSVQKGTDIFLLKNSSSSAQSASLAPSEHFTPKTLRFTEVSKKWQAAILVAGVAFNIIFAWLLFSLGFVVGLPTSVENDFGAEVKNPALTIVGLLPDFPGEIVGLKTGDRIKNISLEDGKILKDLSIENVASFINKSAGQVLMQIDRGGEILDFKIEPKNDPLVNRKLIGIDMDIVGTLSLPIHKALIEGAKVTWKISYLTVGGIFNLIKDALLGKADLSQISGPVGIVGLVGDASRLGFAYLLTFTALISINLAVINLMPFPALDGGRLLFVLVEAITRRAINPKFAQITNAVGFALLIILMLIVTYRDILKLF